ncbi:hypothetical protein GCM10027047_21030 [Rhodococcus aerolatus]
MPLILFLLYVVVEVTALVWVASALGVLATVGLLLLGLVAGLALLRSQGRRSIAQLRDAVRRGRSTDSEVADGSLVVLGGLLFLLPGLVTSTLGILLLLPPVRALVRPAVASAAARRVVRVPRGTGGLGRRGVVVDGEVVTGPTGAPPRRPGDGGRPVLEGEVEQG